MPTFVHGRRTVVLFDQYNLTRFFKLVRTKGEVDAPDKTTLGSTAKEYQTGFSSGEVSAEGLFEAIDPLVVGAAEYFNSVIGAAQLPIITLGPAGLSAVGDSVKLCQADLTSHNVDESIQNLIVTSAQFLASEGLRHGVVLAPLASYTATGNGASVDNLAATSNGAVANLHIITVAGSTPTIDWVVQHSVDNSVWVDLMTFTQATAATKQRLTVTGTVNRYLRAIRTVGGSGGPSFESALSVARL